MDTPRNITVAMVRHALQAFGSGGVEVSNAQLYEALGIATEVEQNRMRTRITDMIAHGEVVRVRAGVFMYDFKKQPRDAQTLVKMWRFVRKSRHGWTLNDCTMMTRVSYTQAMRYVAWLEGEQFVARAGKSDRNAVTYRATPKADATPETPYPPTRQTDPFQKERVAAATITRLMLCADPYAVKTARDIVQACQTLLARFSKNENVTENENEEKGENQHD